MLHEDCDIAAWLECLHSTGPWEKVTDITVQGLTGDIWRSGIQGINRYAAVSCLSSMDVAWSLLAAGEFSPFSWVLALFQSKGRGQLGRGWVSSMGNLFSTVRLPDKAGELGTLLPLGIGLVMVEVMDRIGLPAEVKWPNDLLVGRTKVGGILIEEKQGRIMAGIGLNLGSLPVNTQSENGFRIPAGSLSDFGIRMKPPTLWNMISRTLEERLPGLVNNPDRIQETVESHLAYKDEGVVLEHAGEFSGPVIIAGIDFQGGLRVKTSNGEQTIRSGQICPPVT